MIAEAPGEEKAPPARLGSTAPARWQVSGTLARSTAPGPTVLEIEDRFMRRPLTLVILLTALACWSCVGGGRVKEREQWLRRTASEYGLDADSLDLPLRVTDEMRQWVHQRITRVGTDYEQLLRLLKAMERVDGLDLRHQFGYTGTAEEVFKTGRYNCLSFSYLFVTLARELGIEANYLAVDRVQRYEREGDLILVSGHITVGHGTGLNRRVLQFNVGPDLSYQGARPVSDRRALSLFYANRGAESIRDGRLEDAVEWLEIGTSMDPGEPSGWVNLGVARRRLGDERGAEEAYLRAARAEPGFVPAYTNLAALYRLSGDRPASDRLLEVLGGQGHRNPYLFLALGDSSLERELPDEAETYYRRALRLAERQAEPMAALGSLALTRGDEKEARRWLERAQSQNEQVPRLLRLERDLGLSRRLRRERAVGSFQAPEG